MSPFTLRNWLPKSLRAPMWGDREKWGLVIHDDDPCWQEWQRVYCEFYTANQRNGVGDRVNNAGYRILSSIDLTEKRVLEIGAGDIRHSAHWQGCPGEYILADVHLEMMRKAERCLAENGIPCRSILLAREQTLPLEENSIDVIVSFYSLEHLYPLAPYLADMHRVLKHGGALIGAIPAEGGLAWGGGRMLTSRSWLKNKTSIDPDKIICWEHPNFADEIIATLDRQFQRHTLSWWPMRLPVLDINLVVQFIYIKA